MRLSVLALGLGAVVLLGSSGCSKQAAAETFPYTINGVYVGMPDREALNMLGAPDKVLQDDYVSDGVRIHFASGEVESVMGQILDDAKGVVLRASVDGQAQVVKKLGPPYETVKNSNPHAFFRQIVTYSKGDQLLIIPFDAKTNKIWAIRMEPHRDGYQDMLDR